LQLFLCGTVGIALLLANAGFAAEPVLRPAAPLGSSKSPSVQANEPTATTSETSAAYKEAPANPLRLTPFILAGSLGFIFGLVYLGGKLTNFWGLRVIRNGWSVGFLIICTACSMISAPLFTKFLPQVGDLGQSAGGSVLGSGFVSFVQRLGGRRRSNGGTQPIELARLAAKGFLFDRIRETLRAEIKRELDTLSTKLDWTNIYILTAKAINDGVQDRGLPRDAANKAIDDVKKLRDENPNDPRIDNMNRHLALQRALDFVSFRSFRDAYRSIELPL
jgi:hypothetical protein